MPSKSICKHLSRHKRHAAEHAHTKIPPYRLYQKLPPLQWTSPTFVITPTPPLPKTGPTTHNQSHLCGHTHTTSTINRPHCTQPVPPLWSHLHHLYQRLAPRHTTRVGQNHTYIQIINEMCLEGKSPNIRPYTVDIYGSGRPYSCAGWARNVNAS